MTCDKWRRGPIILTPVLHHLLAIAAKDPRSNRRISKDAGVDPAALRRIRKRIGNPRIDTIECLLETLGYTLKIERKSNGTA